MCMLGDLIDHLLLLVLYAFQLGVERLVKENNVDAEVKQIKISEAASMQDGADLIVSTTILPTTYKIPAIIATSYITGMGMEELDEEILAHLK